MDGRRLVEHADERYRGGPDRPFTRDELHEKFSECAALVLPPAGHRRKPSRWWNRLEKLPDITGLVRSLTRGREPARTR